MLTINVLSMSAMSDRVGQEGDRTNYSTFSFG
jgi:hypothetical protein